MPGPTLKSPKGRYAKKPAKKYGNIKSCIFILPTKQGIHALSFQLAKQGMQRRRGLGQYIAQQAPQAVVRFC